MAPGDRIFVAPRKHFRARYSVTEVKIGVLLALCLLGVALWISWKGGHPAEDFAASAPLLRRDPAPDRGMIPPRIAPPGWQEQRMAEFNPQNVYLKIDGREGYYKSFGFKDLHCLTLAAPGGEPTIDLELYDLGRLSNALGAALGEVPQGLTPRLENDTLWLVDRNAMYLVCGRYYLRAIASTDAPAATAHFAALRERLVAVLPGSPLPFEYAFFAAVGVPPSKVTIEGTNALSFGFANNLYEAAVDEDTLLFLTQKAKPEEAKAMAEQFVKGFARYGIAGGNPGGVRWFKDRYLGRVSAAGSVGNLVVGVYRAADEKAGAALYAKMVAAAGGKP